MVYQILISTMYLHLSNFFLVFMIVGLVGEAVVIAEDFRPLIPPLFLSPDNNTLLLGLLCHQTFGVNELRGQMSDSPRRVRDVAGSF